MSIGISEEHRDLAGSLREWAAGLEGPEAARAADTDPGATFADAWKAVGEMGIAAIALPESVGGGGGDVLDLAVALEACAHQLVPGALLGPAVASLVLRSGRRGRRTEAVVVGLVVGGTAWDTPSATHFLVAGEDDAWSVVPREGCTVTVDTSGSTSPAASATLTVDSTDEAVGVPDLGSETVRRAVVTLAAAEASGVARWCLEVAVDYAKVREQFGQKIGAFQAVKHLCAEMLEQAEAVTAAAWDAANAAHGADDDQWGFAVDVAAATCFDAAVEIAKSCVQVLGGIGFTYEHDAHLYLRRAVSLRALAGASDDAALRLTDAAAGGTRRNVYARPRRRRPGGPSRDPRRGGAGRDAARPTSSARRLADNGYLAPALPRAVRPGRRRGDPAGPRSGAHPGRRHAPRHRDRRLGPADDPGVRHRRAAREVRAALLVGDLVWCQLFSEPSSGSDLASLRTKATKVDGGWRLSGQKVWNSVAERADWGICLARTNPDAPQHKGITYFLVDMKSEGIDVRPLREITGHASVQRGVPRRRVRARRLRRRRGRRRLAAGPGHAGQRAGRDGDSRLDKSTERAVPTRCRRLAVPVAAARRGRPLGRAVDGLHAARGPHHPPNTRWPGAGSGVVGRQAARRPQPSGQL